MKSLGQSLIGIWLAVTAYRIYQTATIPSATIIWGFGFLIIGGLLWYYGDKKEKEKGEQEWIDKHVNVVREAKIEKIYPPIDLSPEKNRKDLKILLSISFVIIVVAVILFVTIKPYQ